MDFFSIQTIPFNFVKDKKKLEMKNMRPSLVLSPSLNGITRPDLRFLNPITMHFL